MRGKEVDTQQNCRLIPMGVGWDTTTATFHAPWTTYNAVLWVFTQVNGHIMNQLKEMYGIRDHRPFHFCGTWYHNRSAFLSEVTSLQTIHQSYDKFVWHFRELSWKEIAFQDALLEHCKHELHYWEYWMDIEIKGLGVMDVWFTQLCIHIHSKSYSLQGT